MNPIYISMRLIDYNYADIVMIILVIVMIIL